MQKLILFLVCVIIFLYTVVIREPWFGVLSYGRHQWLTASTLKYSKYWYYEGPLKLKFALLEEPNSIEFPTVESRVRGSYTTYFPGVIIPFYLFSVLTNSSPNLTVIMTYNLLNHFLIAFILSVTVYVFLTKRGFGQVTALFLAIPPIFIELLTPGMLYWHQNVFFADQAVILPFTFFIFLEVLREDASQRNLKILNILQLFVYFWGFLTEWFFIFIAFVVFIRRKEFLKFSVIPAIMMILFYFQAKALDKWQSTVDKFLHRVGVPGHGLDSVDVNLLGFSDKFWNQYIVTYFGKYGLYLLVFAMAVIFFGFLVRKKLNNNFAKTLTLSAVFFVPCVLQVYFFRNHSSIHDFSTLKFSVPFSVVSFVLVPVLIFEMFISVVGSKRRKLGIVFLLLLVFTLTFSYLKIEHPNYKKLFPNPDYTLEERGNFIFENTNYEDVVFSPNYWFCGNPPHQIAFSLKCVYQVKTLGEIQGFLQKLQGEYRVNLLVEGDINLGDYKDLNIFEKKGVLIKSGKYRLYKMKL